jgi:aminoglycoside phosphotransferase (APT) family kinase protein
VTGELDAFLERTGLVTPGTRAKWISLAGGVSSDIWRVELADRTLCVKRALSRLKVQADWYAPVSRNAYEWAWLKFAAAHVPHAVPMPIAHDAGLSMLAMEYLDPGQYPNWKRLLLEGIVSAQTAADVAALLARLHAVSAKDATLERAFDTLPLFHALRLEPYLLATGAKHPDLAARLGELAERTGAARIALVHGDVSPKNILLGPRGPVFLDAECAWFGDPAFDAAFCLNHFLLKCLVRPAARNAYLECFDRFARAYLADASWEPAAALESRTAALLPALFLARVDGKSPVEYLRDEGPRSLVREIARPMIASPVSSLGEIAARWRAALARL